jgi:hypothetical protein
MLSTTAPSEAPITAGFRAKPEYAGTIHDDASARTYGYRAALVPGIILYGYMANLVVHAWGEDWVARGTMQSRSRRPVYEGDRLLIVAGTVGEDAAGWSVEMEVRDGERNIVATGRATLANAAPAMPGLADFPVLPIADPLPPMAAGGFKLGDRFGSAPETITAEALQDSLDLFGQHWPRYAAEGLIHPSRYPQFATHNALHSYALPTPSIFVSAETQHLGLAHVGATLTSSGFVTAEYERKGNRYIDQRHLVFADGRPVAVVLRTSIYAARKGR